MQTKATYQFSRWFRKETVSLSGDRITISTALRLSDSIQSARSFRLCCLVAIPVREWSRQPGFGFGICICLGGFWMAAAYWLSNGAQLGPVFPGAMLALGLSGLVAAISSARRWRHARFYSEAGELAFALRCPPNDASAFDAFVDEVALQVQSVNSKAQP